MSISFLRKSVEQALSGNPGLTGHKPGRVISRKLLYRRSGLAVIVILALLVGARSGSPAQEKPQLKRPEAIPQEKPVESKPAKKEKGPRAIGLVQISSGKATLIPIAILINGRFYDASAYKADPVPMALERGTVYEVEQTGESQGLFTINGALHSKKPGSISPWLGSGAYLLNGTEAAKTTRKAEDRPVGLDDSSDEPPRLTKQKESKAASPSNASPASTSSAPPSTGSAEKTGTKPASSQPESGPSPGGSSSGGSSSGGSSSPETSKSGEQSAADKAADQGAKEQAESGQGAAKQSSESQDSGNYYRPTLRRGKPTEVAPKEEESTPKGDAMASPAPAAGATEVAAQFVPAISDQGGPDPQSYKYFWKEGEEGERRQQMLAVAADEVRVYMAAREKGAIPAKAPVAKTGAAKGGIIAHKSPAKSAQPVFENVQFHGFDVWKNNQLVMILSVEAHLPPAAGATAAPELYSVSLAARTDIYGNLRKLYSGVTDKFHLDVTPRLELIDAVDADGDGRGELLFRETTDAGSGFVIYRATADKLWKMFDSLGAE